MFTLLMMLITNLTVGVFKVICEKHRMILYMISRKLKSYTLIPIWSQPWNHDSYKVHNLYLLYNVSCYIFLNKYLFS